MCASCKRAHLRSNSANANDCLRACDAHAPPALQHSTHILSCLRCDVQLLVCACRLQHRVLDGLQELSRPYHKPTPEQCQTAATCARCHGLDGIAGVLCHFCKVDEVVTRWEVKLFMLIARTKQVGAYVSEEEAIQAYHKMTVAQVRPNVALQ